MPLVVQQKRLTGAEKSSMPPKVLKKKSESESDEEDDIPLAHSQPEDEQITDSKTLFSDGNPKKGGRGRERNIAAEMSDPETYKTPPGVETTTERNNRLQRICYHWANKWFNYENVRRYIKYCLLSLHLGVANIPFGFLRKMMPTGVLLLLQMVINIHLCAPLTILKNLLSAKEMLRDELKEN